LFVIRDPALTLLSLISSKAFGTISGTLPSSRWSMENSKSLPPRMREPSLGQICIEATRRAYPSERHLTRHPRWLDFEFKPRKNSRDSIRTKHRFFSPSEEGTVEFVGKVVPATHEVFEKSVHIIYVLAEDIDCDAQGLPKSFMPFAFDG
jgi:hypothetical protein